MALIADILLLVAAAGAGLYCMILSRRLARFCDLENGVGGAVAVLAVQVDDLQKTLKAAQTASKASAEELHAITKKAESTSRHLELLMASMHDVEPQPKHRTVRRHRKSEGKEAA